jgi:hypothetical protein
MVAQRIDAIGMPDEDDCEPQRKSDKNDEENRSMEGLFA